MQKRVLIPTNDIGYIYSLAKSYSNYGYEPTAGKTNFYLCKGNYDIVHFLWPEEFSYRKKPSDSSLKELSEILNKWKNKSKLIISVQNLYPHGYEYDPSYKKLYEIFYDACSGIIHHSSASQEIVNKEFPITRNKPNIVTTIFNYKELLNDTFDRDDLRQKFGFVKKDFVILIFGALRSWAEVLLVQKAYSKTKIINKKILLGARFKPLPGSRLLRKIHTGMWNFWKLFLKLPVDEKFVPDNEIYRYFEAADVIVIPKIVGLSSGLVGLGMTFGLVIIAPNHGAFPDYLNETDNFLYKTGDAESLASVLEKASKSDCEGIRKRNRKIARSWSMDKVVKDCIELATMK